MTVSFPKRVYLLVLAVAVVVVVPSCQAQRQAGRGPLDECLKKVTTLERALAECEKRCPPDPTTIPPTTTTTRKSTPSTPPISTTPITTPKSTPSTPPISTTPITTPKPTPPMPMPYMPYDLKWNVADLKSGNVFSHSERSGGQDVTGEYRVLLPNGKTQVVTFWADAKSGYNPVVKYI